MNVSVLSLGAGLALVRMASLVRLMLAPTTSRTSASSSIVPSHISRSVIERLVGDSASGTVTVGVGTLTVAAPDVVGSVGASRCTQMLLFLYTDLSWSCVSGMVASGPVASSRSTWSMSTF